MSKTFHTISRKECLIVYKDILHNSDKKWIAAKKLATIEEYGGAISFLIISIEEMIKAFIIAMDGDGFDFRNIKGIDKFFKDHEIRHAVAFFMFLLSFASEEIKKIALKIQNQEIDMKKIHEEYVIKKVDFWKKNRIWGLRKLITLKRDLDWFSTVDGLRQTGMYCDYKGSLKTPQNINYNDYKVVYNRLKGVREVGKGLIEILGFNYSSIKDEAVRKDETIAIIEEQLTTLKSEFKEKGYYSEISKMLISIGKDNPLELLKTKFQ